VRGFIARSRRAGAQHGERGRGAGAVLRALLCGERAGGRGGGGGAGVAAWGWVAFGAARTWERGAGHVEAAAACCPTRRGPGKFRTEVLFSRRRKKGAQPALCRFFKGFLRLTRGGFATPISISGMPTTMRRPMRCAAWCLSAARAARDTHT
jgi:hypothetical protein